MFQIVVEENYGLYKKTIIKKKKYYKIIFKENIIFVVVCIQKVVDKIENNAFLLAKIYNIARNALRNGYFQE
jgi:hypothetical protein